VIYRHIVVVTKQYLYRNCLALSSFNSYPQYSGVSFVSSSALKKERCGVFSDASSVQRV
jgi:hypothetical protein